MPAVDTPSELTTTITSAMYSTTVMTEMTKVAAALSSLLLSATRRVMRQTMRTIARPSSKKATVRTIAKAAIVGEAGKVIFDRLNELVHLVLLSGFFRNLARKVADVILIVCNAEKFFHSAPGIFHILPHRRIYVNSLSKNYPQQIVLPSARCGG